jgi:mRNA interferase MazF
MIRERQVVLFRFPKTNQAKGKLRPALVVRKVPGPYDDWLISMISSQVSQEVADFDEIMSGR